MAAGTDVCVRSEDAWPELCTRHCKHVLSTRSLNLIRDVGHHDPHKSQLRKFLLLVPWLVPSASQALSHNNPLLQQLYPNLALSRVFISMTPDVYEHYANHKAWEGTTPAVSKGWG